MWAFEIEVCVAAQPHYQLFPSSMCSNWSDCRSNRTQQSLLCGLKCNRKNHRGLYNFLDASVLLIEHLSMAYVASLLSRWNVLSYNRKSLVSKLQHCCSKLFSMCFLFEVVNDVFFLFVYTKVWKPQSMSIGSRKNDSLRETDCVLGFMDRTICTKRSARKKYETNTFPGSFHTWTRWFYTDFNQAMVTMPSLFWNLPYQRFLSTFMLFQAQATFLEVHLYFTNGIYAQIRSRKSQRSGCKTFHYVGVQNCNRNLTSIDSY